MDWFEEMYNELYEKKKSQEAVYEARIRELEEQCAMLESKISELIIANRGQSVSIPESNDKLQEFSLPSKKKDGIDDVKSVEPLTEGLSKLEAKAIQVRVRICDSYII